MSRINDIRATIKQQMGNDSAHLETHHIRVTLLGLVREGPVERFRIFGRSEGDEVYAFVYQESGRPKISVMVRHPVHVNTPQDALKALIAMDGGMRRSRD